jgi:N-hydroxyarylamine O-acetyltransferase
MRLSDYLRRVEWPGEATPTLDTLGKLLRQHNHRVPFENLDVQLGKTLTTSVEEAYAKIVDDGRGGWCYEQNGLFGWALSRIGFDVQRIAATVMRADRGATAHANHLTLLVRQPGDEERWLVDVGFGGSLLWPLPLEEGAYEHAPFNVGLRRLDDGHWQFWENRNDGEFSFDFEEIDADENAMSVRCDYLQTSPESGFVQNLVCQLRRPDSHVSLRGRVLSTVTTRAYRKHVLDSADELVVTLKHEFGLVVPGSADLWERICERHEQLMALD